MSTLHAMSRICLPLIIPALAAATAWGAPAKGGTTTGTATAATGTAAKAQPASLVKNGDFSRGLSGWRTRGRVSVVAEPDGNKVLQIKIDKREKSSISVTNLPIKLEKMRVLRLTFRAKVETDAAKGGSNANVRLMLAFDRPSGWTYTNHTVPPDGEWHTISWTYSDLQTDMGVTLAAEPGAGTVYLDDIVLEPSEN